jgi:hypothetical protein
MPFDPEEGPGYIRRTLGALSDSSLAPSEHAAVLAGNAQRLLDLDPGRIECST